MNVSRLMESYFKERQSCLPSHKNVAKLLSENVPIEVPSEKSWELISEPEALQRLYTFKDSNSLVYFLEDVIQLQEEMSHHAKILIDGNKVLIQVSTRVINRVTDLDVEWSQKVDEIYKDVRSTQK